MRVWLDMANSPHPMLLGPVADELERAGHEVWVTARDHAQTMDLTLRRWPAAVLVGGSSPGPLPAKLWTLLDRVKQLSTEAARHAPDVAVSLNSYAQVLAARANRVPSVTLMDYEFQPANHLSFRLARRIVVPFAFPQRRLRRYGAVAGDRVLRFDGYKEELYLDQLDHRGCGHDGWSAVPGAQDAVRCLFRPPPFGATYHRGGNARFDSVLARSVQRKDSCVLVLARFPEQRAVYRSLPGVTVAEDTVDGLQALAGADVFVGAGGTMCREAALLGVPAYTLFAGRLAAVDAQLISEGRLHDLRLGPVQFDGWVKRHSASSQHDRAHRRKRASALRRWLLSVIEEVAGVGSSSPGDSSQALR